MAKKPELPIKSPRVSPPTQTKGYQAKPQGGYQPTTGGQPAGKPPKGGSVVKK